jgi:citrate lyase subunit beta/citryl-CoA lyase
MVEHAHTFPADVVVLDLEDAVPPGEKEAARAGLRASIQSLKAAGHSVHVRVNHTSTELTRDDLAAAVCTELDGISFPKAEAAQNIRELDVLLREQEVRNQVRPGSVVLIPMIESARGLLRCEDIATASTRIVGLATGTSDFLADLGAPSSGDPGQLDHLRSVVATVCAAYRLRALDSPYVDFQDADGFMREAEHARALGFKGKYVIHPSQVDLANAIFQPSAEEIAKARRIIEAFDAAVAQGHGSVQVDGSMVDIAVARRARALLADEDS